MLCADLAGGLTPDEAAEQEAEARALARDRALRTQALRRQSRLTGGIPMQGMGSGMLQANPALGMGATLARGTYSQGMAGTMLGV